MINIGIISGLGISLFHLQQIENHHDLLYTQGELAAISYDGDCVELGIPQFPNDYYMWGVVDGCIKKKTSLATYHQKDGAPK